MQLVNIMTCGSVDDGKSTLFGRLLFETGNISYDQSDYLNSLNEKFKKKDVEIDYSLLLDGLIDEKEQGITIDIAFKYFTLKNNQFVLIDSPGHKEYTKNMANAATFADVALVLIDASKGLTSQTKKHIEIINMFPNIIETVFCINKMDKVNYSKTKFEEIENTLNKYLESNSFKPGKIIPISAARGDNVMYRSKNLKFYNQQTVFDFLTSLKINHKKNSNGGLVVKFIDNSTGKRLYGVEIFDMKINKGMTVFSTRTGEESKIKNIYQGLEKVEKLDSRNAVFELSEEISINKGDVLTNKNQNKEITNAFKAKVIWCSEADLIKNKRYKFKFVNKEIYGFVSKTNIKTVKKNSVAVLNIELEEKNLVKPVNNNYNFSKLIVIDPESQDTIGFGYCVQNLDKGTFVRFQSVQKIDTKDIKCLWLTGLSGSGKSTIATNVRKELSKKGINSYIIDGDNIRSSLNKDLGFSNEDRIENNRRVAHLARILYEAGVVPIVATISPNKSSRSFARSLFGDNEFLLVHVKASIEECIKRNPKNLYNNKNKKVKNITGIGSKYEDPTNADLVVDTEKLSIKKSVELVINKFKE